MSDIASVPLQSFLCATLSILLVINIKYMLTTIAIVLLILWLVGFIGFHVLGGFIHILLIIAVIMILVRVIRGKKPF